MADAIHAHFALAHAQAERRHRRRRRVGRFAILAGTLTLAAVGVAAPAGALIIDVATDGTCDVLHVEGDLSLAGLSLHVANEADLQKGEIYTVATCTGELLGTFGAVSLPDAWYVYYDWANDAVQLRSNKGTLIRLK
jgi:hypothetical protein